MNPMLNFVRENVRVYLCWVEGDDLIAHQDFLRSVADKYGEKNNVRMELFVKNPFVKDPEFLQLSGAVEDGATDPCNYAAKNKQFIRLEGRPSDLRAPLNEMCMEYKKVSDEVDMQRKMLLEDDGETETAEHHHIQP